jgi:hypothetical protein
MKRRNVCSESVPSLAVCLVEWSDFDVVERQEGSKPLFTHSLPRSSHFLSTLLCFVLDMNHM